MVLLKWKFQRFKNCATIADVNCVLAGMEYREIREFCEAFQTNIENVSQKIAVQIGIKKCKPKKKIRLVKKIVENALNESIRARNDDKHLTFLVLQYYLYHKNKPGTVTITLENLPDLPAFETVTRIRAQIQNVEKRFLPTNAAVKKRRKMRQSYFQHEFADTFGPFI